MSAPTPQAIAAVYDFERVLEFALKTVLEAAQLKAFTSQAVPAGNDDAQNADLVAQGYELLDFQKDRPRVEIEFVCGAGQRQFVPHPDTGVETEAAWKGQYLLKLVTAADMRLHSALRTMVRYQMQKLRGTINDVAPMTLHNLQLLTDAGTSPVITPEDGVFLSTMNFDIDFSIQADAWAQLVTT